MSDKIAIIYWSGTGNTEIMAQNIKKGVENAGGNADIFSVSGFDSSSIDNYSSTLLRYFSLYYANDFSISSLQMFFNDLEPFSMNTNGVDSLLLSWKYENGNSLLHTMYTGALKEPYIKRRNTYLVDTYFNPDMFQRRKLSNIWINMYDAYYTVQRLSELALEGKTLFAYPHFYM